MTVTATRTRTRSGATLHVGAPGPAVAAQAAALLNESLGDGFIQAAELEALAAESGGVLIRARGRRGQLLGAATARVLNQASVTALHDRLGRAGVDAGLAEHLVGELKSAAVAPAGRGRGIGTDMIRARLNFLRAQGCTLAVCASWVSGAAGHSSLGLLEAAGFARMAAIPAYWAEEQKAAGYLCPSCGSECACVAVVMVCLLED